MIHDVTGRIGQMGQNDKFDYIASRQQQSKRNKIRHFKL